MKTSRTLIRIRRFRRLLAAALILAAGTALAAQAAGAPSAAALLAALDNHQAPASSHSIGVLTVTDRYGTAASGFETWTSGSDKTLLAFTSGEEKGQKILRLKDTIYLAYPDADKPIKLQGAALRDSVAGSDFSFEDMNGERGYASRYTPRLTGSETVAGEACHVLELEAKRPGLTYPFIKLWISERDQGLRKAEQYSQNRRLLKVQEILAVTRVGARVVPTEIVMTDQLKPGSRTVLKLSTVDMDRPVDARLFSLEELQW